MSRACQVRSPRVVPVSEFISWRSGDHLHGSVSGYFASRRLTLRHSQGAHPVEPEISTIALDVGAEVTVTGLVGVADLDSAPQRVMLIATLSTDELVVLVCNDILGTTAPAARCQLRTALPSTTASSVPISARNRAGKVSDTHSALLPLTVMRVPGSRGVFRIALCALQGFIDEIDIRVSDDMETVEVATQRVLTMKLRNESAVAEDGDFGDVMRLRWTPSLLDFAGNAFLGVLYESRETAVDAFAVHWTLAQVSRPAPPPASGSKRGATTGSLLPGPWSVENLNLRVQDAFILEFEAFRGGAGGGDARHTASGTPPPSSSKLGGGNAVKTPCSIAVAFLVAAPSGVDGESQLLLVNEKGVAAAYNIPPSFKCRGIRCVTAVPVFPSSPPAAGPILGSLPRSWAFVMLDVSGCVIVAEAAFKTLSTAGGSATNLRASTADRRAQVFLSIDGAMQRCGPQQLFRDAFLHGAAALLTSDSAGRTTKVAALCANATAQALPIRIAFGVTSDGEEPQLSVEVGNPAALCESALLGGSILCTAKGHNDDGRVWGFLADGAVAYRLDRGVDEEPNAAFQLYAAPARPAGSLVPSQPPPIAALHVCTLKSPSTAREACELFALCGATGEVTASVAISGGNDAQREWRLLTSLDLSRAVRAALCSDASNHVAAATIIPHSFVRLYVADGTVAADSTGMPLATGAWFAATFTLEQGAAGKVLSVVALLRLVVTVTDNAINGNDEPSASSTVPYEARFHLHDVKVLPLGIAPTLGIDPNHQNCLLLACNSITQPTARLKVGLSAAAAPDSAAAGMIEGLTEADLGGLKHAALVCAARGVFGNLEPAEQPPIESGSCVTAMVQTAAGPLYFGWSDGRITASPPDALEAVNLGQSPVCGFLESAASGVIVAMSVDGAIAVLRNGRILALLPSACTHLFGPCVDVVVSNSGSTTLLFSDGTALRCVL